LAVGVGAITVGLIINQMIDRAIDYTHRRRLVQRYSSRGVALAQTGSFKRCDLCQRIQVQAHDVWVCPHCDNAALHR
jgi:hypothetical protein